MFEDKTILSELNRLISQLSISDSAIAFRGNVYPITPGNTLESLTNILYSECYALKERYQSGLAAKQEITGNELPFLELLSDNNHSKNRIEGGWKIKNNHGNGYVEIGKNSQNKVVQASAITENGSVIFSKEDRHRQPTFYYVFSNQNIEVSQRFTRIYWNITAQGAPVLINNITSILNSYQIPFLFKCLNHPSLYFRRDAAVLYIEDNSAQIVSMLLPQLCENMESYLEEDVPLFSFKYQKGVGIAESPNHHESFGMNRMALTANALIKSSSAEAANMINTIADKFIENGINPTTPFLNKGSRILLN